MDIYDEIVRLRKSGQKCALATIVQVNGSIPSYESAKLLVREDGSIVGTVGGGCVEAEVWNAAREVIETEQSKHLTFSLGQDAAYDNGLICGGQLNVFVEPITPQPRAFIFGAGHISKSLSKVATLAGFATVVIDDREAEKEGSWTAGKNLKGFVGHCYLYSTNQQATIRFKFDAPAHGLYEIRISYLAKEKLASNAHG